MQWNACLLVLFWSLPLQWPCLFRCHRHRQGTMLTVWASDALEEQEEQVSTGRSSTTHEETAEKINTIRLPNEMKSKGSSTAPRSHLSSSTKATSSKRTTAQQTPQEANPEDEQQQETTKTLRQVQVLQTKVLSDISELLKDPTSSSASLPPSPALHEYRQLFDSNVTLVLTLIYAETCTACAHRVKQFVHQVPQLWQQQQQEEPSWQRRGVQLPPPVLMLLAVEDNAHDKQQSNNEPLVVKQLENFGISQIPVLMWMMSDSLGHTFVLDFAAAQAPDDLTAAEILRAYQHVQNRLLLLSASVAFDDASGVFRMKPKCFSTAVTQNSNGDAFNRTFTTLSVNPLEAWFLDNGLNVFQSVEQAFPGPLLESERSYAQWLWDQYREEAHDGFLLLGQCRTPESKASEAVLQHTFDRLMTTWIDRRDVAMVGLADCPPANNDKVYQWRIFPEQLDNGTLDLSFENAERIFAVNALGDKAAYALKNALVGATTPSLLWLDRQSTAPIAFPTWRKVHAVLVVDVHRATSLGATRTPLDHKQAEAIQQFRRLCRNHQRNRMIAEDVVCLVVPSTEIRILTTFGIDIWTPLDMAAWQSQDDVTSTEILPVFFITDQRFGGTRRYYLEGDIVDSMSDFWNSFWSGELQPFPKSSPTSSRSINKAGVMAITATQFRDEVLRRSSDDGNSVPSGQEKHSLVLFTSSMCGHCRRLLALYDQFGRLIQKVGWSSFLTLYQMDVSTDEVMQSVEWNQTVRWVPDLFYVSPGDSPSIIRFEEEDAYGDNVVGGIKSYMDMVEWFLHVASLEDSKILALLSDIRNLIQAKD